jgi:hypothetical protein
MATTTKPARVETATRVLLYDIETSPNLAYVWGKFEQNALGDFVQERQIISFAWKWLGESEVQCLSLRSFSGRAKASDNNRALILRLHALMSQADIVVGHNVMEFDDKMANTGFVKHGLKPPPPHKAVDTLRIARDKFRFNSNRLNDLGKFLDLGEKVRHSGFDLWLGCLRGDPKSWTTMELYNKGDVTLLEKIYLKLRPWGNHPSMTALDGFDGCPHCRAASKRVQWRGWQIAGGKRQRRAQCQDCGHWCRGVQTKAGWRFA